MNKQFLPADSGVQDPLIHAVDNNPFIPPNDWGTINNHKIQRLEISPVTSITSIPGTADFEIPKSADVSAKCKLKWTVSAVTATNSTYVRLNDYAGMLGIDKVELFYGTNMIQKLQGDDILEEALTEKERKFTVSAATFAGGELTNLQRENRATAAQSFEVDLPLFFSRDIAYSFHNVSYGQKPRISVTFRNLNDFVNTDGTAPTCTVSSVKLEVEYYHVTPKDRTDIINSTHMETGQGVLYKLVDIERQEFNVTSGDTTSTLKLTAIRQPVQDLRVFIKRSADVTSAASFANDLARYYPAASSIKFSANSVDYHKDETDLVLRGEWNPRYHATETILPFYTLPFSHAPDDKVHSWGSLNIGNTNDPSVVITWPSGGCPFTAKVFVKGYVQTFVQALNGDLSTIFK